MGTPVDRQAAASSAGAARMTRPPIEPLETPFRLQLHSQADLDRLKDATYEILATVGVKFPSPTALEILAAHGCAVDAATQIVTFPRELVEKAMARAPRHFTLGARDPACELPLTASTPTLPPTAAASRSSTSRPASAGPPPRPTWPHITRMVDYLPGLSFWWPTVSAADCAQTAQLHELEVGFANTVKHLQGMVMGARQARYAVEMATVIAGSAAELRRRPVLSDLIGTISPAARHRRHRGRPGLRRGRCAGVLREHGDDGHHGAATQAGAYAATAPSWSAPRCSCSSPTLARRSCMPTTWVTPTRAAGLS